MYHSFPNSALVAEVAGGGGVGGDWLVMGLGYGYSFIVILISS